tara:strand:- start:261 stop:653 length:393 start_codon:yes stop_codon:yes gene_type:complete
MKKSELKQLIREEIREIKKHYQHKIKGWNTAPPQFSDENNARMFINLKNKAEDLYNEYTKSGRVPGIFGIERDVQKWKNTEELDQINRWFVEWGKALKTSTTYNDLLQTLEILPNRLKAKFKKELLNIKA